MKKIIISIILILSLFLNSCASIKVNGIEIRKKTEADLEVEANTEDIIGWTILIGVSGLMYIGGPIYIATHLKKY